MKSEECLLMTKPARNTIRAGLLYNNATSRHSSQAKRAKLDMTGDSPLSYESVIRRYTLTELTAWVDMPMPERYGCIDIDERRVIPDIEIRYAVIKACGLRSISDFQLMTLERRKSVIQEVMRSLDVRPRQLSRVTGMNYETIRNIAKKLP